MSTRTDVAIHQCVDIMEPQTITEEAEDFTVPSLRSFSTEDELRQYAKEEGLLATPSIHNAWQAIDAQVRSATEQVFSWSLPAFVIALLAIILQIEFVGTDPEGFFFESLAVFSASAFVVAGAFVLISSLILLGVFCVKYFRLLRKSSRFTSPDEKELLDLIQAHHRHLFEQYKESLIGDNAPVERELKKLDKHREHLINLKKRAESEKEGCDPDDPEDAAFLADVNAEIERIEDEIGAIGPAIGAFDTVKERLQTVVADVETQIEREEKYASKRERRFSLLKEMQEASGETRELLSGSRKELFESTFRSLSGLAAVLSRVRAIESRHLALFSTESITGREEEIRSIESLANELKDAVQLNGEEIPQVAKRVSA